MNIVLRDPANGQYTNYLKFVAREQRRQDTYTAAWAMTVEVEPVQPAKPVCRWSEQTLGEYVKRDRVRAINWTSV